tara:strand:- start:1588 stop:3909 length:2322 start_codon:yes stop_codon:yes gene_type:complete
MTNDKIEQKYSSHPVRSWFIKQSLDRPIRSILYSLFATIIMGIGGLFFMIDDDMMKLLPSDLDSKISWDDIQDEFGSTELIYIAFGKKGESVFSTNNFTILWDLTKSLEEENQIEEVSSLSNISRIDNVDDFMEVDDLQSNRNLTTAQLDEIQKYLIKNPSIKKRFISEDEEYFAIYTQPYGNETFDLFSKVVVDKTNDILDGYEVHYGGNAYISGIMPGLIRNDAFSLMRYGLLIMILTLLINLRSIAGVAMVLMVIILSLLSMIGGMGWIYYFTGSNKFLFTLANTSMPIILLTIANSDGVHIVSKFFREMRSKKDSRIAIASTMDSLLVPIFITTVTTVSAFLIMTTSPIQPLIGYGISISIGIIWAWFLSSLLLPAVISLKTWNPELTAFTKPSFFEKLVDKLGSAVINHPKRVLGTGLIIVLIGLIGVTKVTVDVNMRNFFKPGTEIRDSMDFMDNEMNGTVDIRVRVEGDIKDPINLNDMSNLQSFMVLDDQVSTSFSIADIVKQMHRTVMDDDPKFETIPESRGKINNLFTMYSMSGDPEDFEELVDYEYNVGLITAFADVMSTEQIFRYTNQLNDHIEKNFNQEASIDVTGMIVVFRDLVILIVRSSFISIFASLFVIGILASLFFKRALWGLLAIVPLTSAVIINFGFMGFFGIELSHVTAILSSIIIGVGVDFAIHYISQFRRLSRSMSSEKVSKEVVEDVGYPIVLDAASNMGFGALVFSAFVPIQYIGGLMVFAMLSTSLGTLTILSAITELFKKRLIVKG